MNTSELSVSNGNIKLYPNVHFCYKEEISLARIKENNIEMHKENASICYSNCVRMFEKTGDKYCFNK